MNQHFFVLLSINNQSHPQTVANYFNLYAYLFGLNGWNNFALQINIIQLWNDFLN